MRGKSAPLSKNACVWSKELCFFFIKDKLRITLLLILNLTLCRPRNSKSKNVWFVNVKRMNNLYSLKTVVTLKRLLTPASPFLQFYYHFEQLRTITLFLLLVAFLTKRDTISIEACITFFVSKA